MHKDTGLDIITVLDYIYGPVTELLIAKFAARPQNMWQHFEISIKFAQERSLLLVSE